MRNKVYWRKYDMKKAIATLLILMLSISTLAACGGDDTPEPVVKQALEPTPEPTPELEPEPAADEMITVKITNDDFGDIIFSVPDDGSVTVKLAEPGAEGRSLMSREEIEDILGLLIERYYDIDFQEALIEGDDFYILVGYTHYNEDAFAFKSFYMLSYFSQPITFAPLIIDGLDGFEHASSFLTIALPAITQYAGRLIILFHKSYEDNYHHKELNQELYERADIQAILSTFEFPGEILDEPRLELQPQDCEFFSITPTDGWKFANIFESNNWFALVKGDMLIEISVSQSSPVSEKIEEYINSDVYTDCEQLDNITLNGQEFVVLYSRRLSTHIVLTSLRGGPLDLNSDGHVRLYISNAVSLDDFTPLLSALTIK